MNRERALHRRYWTLGILCSIIFHGAIVFVPLQFMSVLTALPRLLKVEMVVPEPLRESPSTPLREPRKTQAESSPSPKTISPQKEDLGKSQEIGTDGNEDGEILPESIEGQSPAKALQTPDMAPTYAHAVERTDIGVPQEALSAAVPIVQEPAPMPSLLEENVALKSIGRAAAAPATKQVDVGSENLSAVVPGQETPKSARPFVASRAETVEEVKSSPATNVIMPAPDERSVESVKTAAPETARTAQAEVSPNAPPRQFFALAGDLLAQTKNISGSPPARADTAGPARPESDNVQTFAGGAPQSASLQMAELKAERITSYHASQYHDSAADGTPSAQPARQSLEALEPLVQAPQIQGQSPKETGDFAERAVPASTGKNSVSPGMATSPERNISEAGALQPEAPVEAAGEEPRETAASTSQQKTETLQPAVSPVAQANSVAFSQVPPDETSPSGATADQDIPAQPLAAQNVSPFAPAQPDLAGTNPPHFDTAETLSRRIIAELSAQKEYPPSALKRKTEGTVSLFLDVAPNGSLVVARIQTRSGSAILDEAALKLVRSIFPLNVRLASAVSLVVPIEYRIPK